MLLDTYNAWGEMPALFIWAYPQHPGGNVSQPRTSPSGAIVQTNVWTGMGSPVSVAVANLVMEDVEGQALVNVSQPTPLLETICG